MKSDLSQDQYLTVSMKYDGEIDRIRTENNELRQAVGVLREGMKAFALGRFSTRNAQAISKQLLEKTAKWEEK